MLRNMRSTFLVIKRRHLRVLDIIEQVALLKLRLKSGYGDESDKYKIWVLNSEIAVHEVQLDKLWELVIGNAKKL